MNSLRVIFVKRKKNDATISLISRKKIRSKKIIRYEASIQSVSPVQTQMLVILVILDKYIYKKIKTFQRTSRSVVYSIVSKRPFRIDTLRDDNIKTRPGARSNLFFILH